MSGLRPSKDDDRRSSFHMGCTILKSRKLMKAVKYEGIGACDSGINTKCTVSVPPYGRWANAILTRRKQIRRICCGEQKRLVSSNRLRTRAPNILNSRISGPRKEWIQYKNKGSEGYCTKGSYRIGLGEQLPAIIPGGIDRETNMKPPVSS